MLVVEYFGNCTCKLLRMFIVSGSSCREEQFRMDDREREREQKKVPYGDLHM